MEHTARNLMECISVLDHPICGDLNYGYRGKYVTCQSTLVTRNTLVKPLDNFFKDDGV